MTTIKFSAASSATAATSITVALGGTPSVGDLVVVWLGVSNQIVVQPPGYNGTNQWSKAGGLFGPSNATALNLYYHTWNASDSGSSAVFTFSPAPTLGVGDLDLSSASAVAMAAVVAGPTAPLDYALQGVMQPQPTVPSSPVKRAASLVLTGAYSATGGGWTASGGVSLGFATQGGSQNLTLFSSSAPVNPGYSPVFTSALPGDLMVASISLSDSGAQVYTPPVIQEAPVASDDPLLMRYKLQRAYTVLNNAGTYSAQRYLSTDQVNAATAVYTNNAPVTSAIRTAILNSGVGGEFRATA
jgi:hypothetical protein